MPQGKNAKLKPGGPIPGEFRAQLLVWFDLHKRDLPWRRTHDPYAIWVSEIMLQQTRVAAVLDHYARWMQRFPTVESLAAATEPEILAAWSGLGYYRRARFLHQGAKAVVAEFNGKLPRTATGLRKLPGIGAYTSAAIASIAFGEAAAVVDGNVERVLLRQTGNREKGAPGSNKDQPAESSLYPAAIQALANQLIDPARPGDFNQAMMELGATICLPRNPLCLQCPVQSSCSTRGEHPTVARKASLNVDVSYALFQRKKDSLIEVLLEQRDPGATVMPGMWELPRNESPNPQEKLLLSLRHSIMQTNFRVSVIEAIKPEATSSHTKDTKLVWIPLLNLSSLPLTGLARKIFLRLGLTNRR
jgi:A/G-specific adenine glycosylase